HLDGQLRQWRRLLPLLVCGRAGLRPHRTGRYLRPWMPADRRSAGLRHPAAAEENPPRDEFRRHEDGSALMEAASVFADRLRARFPDAAVSVDGSRGEVGVVFDAAAWHEGCRALRDEFGFEQLIDVCGI